MNSPSSQGSDSRVGIESDLEIETVESPSRKVVLERSISSLRDDIDALKAQKMDLLNSEEESEEENVRLRSELDTLREAHETSLKEISDLRSHNAVLLSDSMAYKTEMLAAQSEVANLKSEIEKNTASFEKIKTGYNTSMDEMKNKLKGEMLKLINANKSLKEELSEAMATIEDLDQQLSESEKVRRSNDEQLQNNSTVKALTVELDQLKSELTEQKQKYEKLQDELLLNQRESLQIQSKLLSEMSALRMQMTQKDEEHAKAAATLQDQISSTVAEHALALDHKDSEHRAVVDALQGERSDLTSQLTEVRGKATDLERQLEAAEIKRLELESSLDAQERDCNTLRESVEEAKLTLASKVQELEQLHVRLSDTVNSHTEVLESHKEVALVQGQMLNDLTVKNGQLHEIITSYELQLSSTLGMIEDDEQQRNRLISTLRADLLSSQERTSELQSQLTAEKSESEQRVAELTKSVEKLTSLSGEYLDDSYAAQKECDTLKNQLEELQELMQLEADQARKELLEERDVASGLLRSAEQRHEQTQRQLRDAMLELQNLRRECESAGVNFERKLAATIAGHASVLAGIRADHSFTVESLTTMHQSTESMLKEDHRRRLVLLHQTIDELQLLSVDLNTEKAQLQESLAQATAEIEKLRTTELQLNEKNDEFLTLTSTLDEDLTAAKEKISLLEETLSVSLNELKKAQVEDESERCQLQERLREKEEQVQVLQMQLSEIRAMWDDEQSRRLSIAVSERRTAEDLLKSAQKELKEVMDQCKILQKELVTMKASEVNLSTELKTLSEQLISAQQQIVELNRTNEKLTILSGEYLDDQYTAEKEAESLRGQLEALQVLMQEESDQARVTLKQRTGELNERIVELERLLEETRANHVSAVIEKELKHQALLKSVTDDLSVSQLSLERSRVESEDRRKQLLDANLRLEALSQTNQQLVDRVSELEGEVAAKETSIEALLEKTDKLLRMSAECQDETLTLQKEWDTEKVSLNDELSQLKLELQSVQQQLVGLKAQHEVEIKEMLGRLDEANKEIESLRQHQLQEETKFFNLEHEFNELVTEKELQIKEIEQLATAVKELELRLEEAELEGEAFAKKNEKLVAICSGLQEELLSITQRGEQALNILEEENLKYKDQLDRAKKDAEELRASESQLKDQLEKSVAQVKELTSLLEAETCQCQELGQSLRSVSAERQENVELLAAARKRIAEQSEEVASLTERLKESEDQCASLSRTKQSTEDDLARVSLALANAVKESALLQGDLDATQGQVAQMTRETDVIRKLMEKLKSDLSLCQTQLKEKTCEVEDWQQKCTSLEEAKSNLTRRVSVTELSLDDHKKMIQDAAEAAARMQAVLDESKKGAEKEIEQTRAELNLLLVEKQQMLTALGEELAEALHALKNCEVACESFKIALTEKSTECNDLSVRYEKLLAVSGGYQNDLLEAQKEVERLQSELETVEDASEQMRLSLKEKFASATEEWTKIMNEGNKKAAQKETQIFALNKQVEELTATVAGKTKQYDALKVRLVELEAAASQTKTLSADLTLIKKQYREKLNECDSLREKVTELETQLKDQSKTHSAEMLHLRTQLKELQSVSVASPSPVTMKATASASGTPAASKAGSGFTSVKLPSDTVSMTAEGAYTYTPKSAGAAGSGAGAGVDSETPGSNGKKKVVIPTLELSPTSSNYYSAALDPPALIQSLQNSGDITVAGLSSLLNKNSDQLSPNILKSHDLRSPIPFVPKPAVTPGANVLSPDASRRLPASSAHANGGGNGVGSASGMKSPRLKSQVTPRTTTTSAFLSPTHHQQQQHSSSHHLNPPHSTPAAHSVNHSTNGGGGAQHAILAESTPGRGNGGVPWVYEGAAATYSNNFNRIKSASKKSQ